MAKCPHCDAVISSLNIQEVTSFSGKHELKTLLYVCRNCQKVISAQTDPNDTNNRESP